MITTTLVIKSFSRRIVNYKSHNKIIDRIFVGWLSLSNQKQIQITIWCWDEQQACLFSSSNFSWPFSTPWGKMTLSGDHRPPRSCQEQEQDLFHIRGRQSCRFSHLQSPHSFWNIFWNWKRIQSRVPFTLSFEIVRIWFIKKKLTSPWTQLKNHNTRPSPCIALSYLPSREFEN